MIAYGPMAANTDPISVGLEVWAVQAKAGADTKELEAAIWRLFCGEPGAKLQLQTLIKEAKAS